MKEIDANSVDYCTDESVMEFLESTQERDASAVSQPSSSKQKCWRK
jgi:hypothetical protein